MISYPPRPNQPAKIVSAFFLTVTLIVSFVTPVVETISASSVSRPRRCRWRTSVLRSKPSYRLGLSGMFRIPGLSGSLRAREGGGVGSVLQVAPLDPREPRLNGDRQDHHHEDREQREHDDHLAAFAAALSASGCYERIAGVLRVRRRRLHPHRHGLRVVDIIESIARE